MDDDAMDVFQHKGTESDLILRGMQCPSNILMAESYATPQPPPQLLVGSPWWLSTLFHQK